jgi:drug/metabolite transporter (DMT)-like permease
MTVFLGLTAAVSWAGVNLWLVSLSRRLPPLVTMLVLLAASGLATLPLGLALEGLPGPEARDHLPVVAIAGLLELAAFVCYLKAVKVGSLAVVAPLLGLEGGVASLIAIAGGEEVTGPIVVGLVMAVIGTSLACATRGERRAAGAGWALTAGLMFGVMFVLYGHAAPLEPFSAVTAARLAAIVVLAPFVLMRARVWPTRADVAALSMIGIIDALAFCAFAAAATRGPISVASVCAAQFSSISVGLGILLLHERPARVQLAGIALTLLGTTLLAAAG